VSLCFACCAWSREHSGGAIVAGYYWYDEEHQADRHDLTPQSTAFGAANHPLVNKGKLSTLAHVS
jgi:hypothetical protein